MIRTKLAHKVLTQKDQTHLTKDAGVHSLQGFINSRKAQAEMKLASGNEPCWHCADIARKLGIES